MEYSILAEIRNTGKSSKQYISILFFALRPNFGQSFSTVLGDIYESFILPLFS